MLELIEDLGLKFPKNTSKTKVRYGLYKCHCGTEKVIQTPMVNNGRTISCGCRVVELGIRLGLAARKHNDRCTRLYGIWGAMKNRTSNPNAINAKYYVDKGISICEEWNEWLVFKKWAMSNGYLDTLTIDRIDSNGNYEPANCRWVSMAIQMATKSMIATNTSGYIGVNKRNQSNKWIARVQFEGKRINCGTFNTALEAAIAYNKYIVDNNLPNTLNNI